jgi:hypothetical protein
MPKLDAFVHTPFSLLKALSERERKELSWSDVVTITRMLYLSYLHISSVYDNLSYTRRIFNDWYSQSNHKSMYIHFWSSSIFNKKLYICHFLEYNNSIGCYDFKHGSKEWKIACSWSILEIQILKHKAKNTLIDT